MDYGKAVTKANDHRRKARAWSRAAEAILKAERALEKAALLESDNENNTSLVKKVGNW